MRKLQAAIAIHPRMNCGLGLEVPSGLVFERYQICQQSEETPSETDVIGTIRNHKY
jgi:hypothetical protein